MDEKRQGDLFARGVIDEAGNERDEPTAPFQRHSDTSREAAFAIDDKLNALQARVLAAIASCESHGATDEELQERLALNPSTERPRRIELCDKRFVVDSGRRRLTRAGRRAVVWVLR